METIGHDEARVGKGTQRGDYGSLLLPLRGLCYRLMRFEYKSAGMRSYGQPSDVTPTETVAMVLAAVSGKLFDVS